MSELARMAQEALHQYEAGETEEGGFAPDGGNNMSDRDTHFAGFAQAVTKEIIAAYGDRGINLEGTPYDPALVISDIIVRHPAQYRQTLTR